MDSMIGVQHWQWQKTVDCGQEMNMQLNASVGIQYKQEDGAVQAGPSFPNQWTF